MADTDLHYQTGTKDLKQDDKYTYNRNYAAHREGITQTEMVETYSKWAKDYDQVSRTESRPRVCGRLARIQLNT